MIGFFGVRIFSTRKIFKYFRYSQKFFISDDVLEDVVEINFWENRESFLKEILPIFGLTKYGYFIFIIERLEILFK